jgi:hypothetical protein
MPVTVAAFRRLALSLPEAVEGAHMGHADFRVGGKIFATLGAPDASFGAVMLTPEQQRAFVESYPKAFVPVKGGWGLKGATNVVLAGATEKTLLPGLAAAWRNRAPKTLALPEEEPGKEAKTDATAASVSEYLDSIPNVERRADCRRIARMMQAATGERPKMWGLSIVGFGKYHYVYDSGHQGDCAIVSFASRKNDITLYLMPGWQRLAALMDDLGRHKAGQGCLYIKRLADVDERVLAKLIALSVRETKKTYGGLKLKKETHAAPRSPRARRSRSRTRAPARR